MGTMMGSRRATRTLALVCVLALASPARWASAATVAEIAKNPAAFDGKPVFVTGTAGEISSRTSRRGNRSTTFTLSDQGEAVKVFTFGTPTIKDGDRVEVSGVLPAGPRRAIHLLRRDRSRVGEPGEVGVGGGSVSPRASTTTGRGATHPRGGGSSVRPRASWRTDRGTRTGYGDSEHADP